MSEPLTIPCHLQRATTLSAGYDFVIEEDLRINSREWTKVDTRVNVFGKVMKNAPAVNEWVFLIFPRSSLGFKHGFKFANTTCVIDADFNDNIVLSCWVDTTLILKRGDKLCQGIFLPYLTLAGEIEPTKKREGGIGSTDK